VQKLWSDVANACVASAPSKITPIHPGPGGAETAGISRLGRGPVRSLDPTDVVPHDRVLPLPPVRFNHQTGTKQILDADMLAYTRKLFSPLRHHHLFHDFPGFLRQAATVLENRSSQPNGPLSEPAEQSEESVARTQPEAVAEVIRRGIAPKAQPRANGQGQS